MAWSKIHNFHLSSPWLHQTVLGAGFFLFSTKDGHCLSPLLPPEGAACGSGRKRNKYLWTLPWCCNSRAVPEPVLRGCCTAPSADAVLAGEPQGGMVLPEPQPCAELCCVCALLPPALLALAGECWYPCKWTAQSQLCSLESLLAPSQPRVSPVNLLSCPGKPAAIHVWNHSWAR